MSPHQPVFYVMADSLKLRADLIAEIASQGRAQGITVIAQDMNVWAPHNQTLSQFRLDRVSEERHNGNAC